jgi:ABC-type transport system substrate-binding protein
MISVVGKGGNPIRMYMELRTRFLTLIFGWVLAATSMAQSIERVTVGETSDADQLNPYTNFSATGSYINEYLYCALLRTDKSSGDFVPLLAESLPKISDDLLGYTYSLNPLAKFNSGKKVTARDVVFSLKMIRNPYVNNSQKRVQYDAIAGAEILDEHTVTIRVNKPNSQGLRLTGDFAVLSEDYFDPSHSLDAVSIAEESQGDKLSMVKSTPLKATAEKMNVFGSTFASFNEDATCGTYVLLNWRRGAEILLGVNKKFWGRKLTTLPNDYFKQNVAEIRFEINSDEATLRKAVFDQRYDMMTSVPQALFANLSEIPNLAKNYQFLSPPSASYEYIGLNTKTGARQRNIALEDLSVRQALARIVHVDLLMVQVCNGLGTRITSEFSASHPDCRNADLSLIPFDLKKANEILEKAGWIDRDGNGIREKTIDGEEVSLVLECIYNDNKRERQQIAEHLQANAREAGMLISVTPLPWADYLKQLKSGDFDIYLGAWVPDPNEDSYRQIWHTKSWGKGSNFVGFGSEASDKLIEMYDETIENGAHRALAHEIQKLIYDAQPYIFLWANNQCLIVSRKFTKAPIYTLRPGFWIPAWE